MRRKIYFLIEGAIKIFSNLSRIRFLQNLKFNFGNANNVGSIKLKRVLAATCVATASRRGYAKHRLAKFKGIKKGNFLLHLKECEFRYNTKTTQENLYQKLLKLIRENPLKFN